MSKEKIRKIWLWATGALLVVMAVCLIFGCIRIYNSGARPFSREAIKAVVTGLAVPGVGCLVLVLGGCFLPKVAGRQNALRDEKALLDRYHEQNQSARKEQALRKKYRVITLLVVLALCIFPLAYFCNFDNFTIANLSSDIFRGILVALIPGAIGLLAVYLCGEAVKRSIHRELEIRKNAGEKPDAPAKSENFPGNKRNVVRIGLFTLAAILLVMGICNGGAADVLGKAIRICTECIGLG